MVIIKNMDIFNLRIPCGLLQGILKLKKRDKKPRGVFRRLSSLWIGGALLTIELSSGSGYFNLVIIEEAWEEAD